MSVSISIVIPVFNRADEVFELLESLIKQDLRDVELIIVEDGSTEKCEHIIAKYTDIIDIKYYFKENGGPSKARNFGVSKAKNDYIIILDSDVVLPEKYIALIKNYLINNDIDAFGGPDAASDDFTDIQKAINYSMTSSLTTGGIRGGSDKGMEKFKPRSFNMGCKRKVCEALSGFDESMRFGEDIDFSLRLFESAYKVVLIKDAFVYHKRRIDFNKFFKQVYNSGMARVALEAKHPKSTKLVHLIPALFILFLIITPFISVKLYTFALALFYVILFIHSYLIVSNSFRVSLLAPIASFIQIFAYGLGFWDATFRYRFLGKSKSKAFDKTFYK